MDPEPPSIILWAAFDYTQVISFIFLLLLLLCSAMISGAEVAFFSLTPADFMTEDGHKRTKSQEIVIKLLEKPKKLLATILVANNFINIAIVLLFDSVSDELFSGFDMVVFGLNLKLIFEVGVVTFLILLFGEILPKVYASRNNVQFSNLMAQPVNVLDSLFSPLSVPMRAVTLYLHEKLGKQRSFISIDHLSQALELTSEEDTTKEEQKILKGIVSFGNTDTKQVMRPRMDVFAISDEDTYAEIIPVIIENGYSRIPVYKENIDNVTGILYIKDLLPYLDRSDFEWTSLLREPYFVPENKKLDDLLNEFKEKKNHLAIVVDEYGGTSGLITLEDIIEEIVGDISDEFDDEDLIYSKLDEFNFVFEGRTPLKDFYKIIKLEDASLFEDNKGEAETLAGFLLEISGDFPQQNEIINFGNYNFKVEAVDDRRIKQIKLTILPV
ncbi:MULTISPECIES: gliding motility-associated protein GldE [Zunongwangia]|uniref:Gliding motility protein GldE n=2 Tax=Zunongwangia profunda TaxID=398743 RepID=D5BCG4_ZUNPS|nr:gliding motility-associated protein GldE [Zunongwangia profunda]MAG86770.1 gliding motility-associated protein GldE [Flavobacteriaceae bacterium]MAS71635.1 gliding motility-associated protein GldE [Zunongwangia sp.]ADF54790.1 gliding motility protein GldE [Zunongwangia profunda SM-A87]MCC4226721.1 gliding motility-associated protein GldE [Zunongwangia profunda]HCV83074.1 gliding motility-associated protein GldE [Zunongwangia profunda]